MILECIQYSHGLILRGRGSLCMTYNSYIGPQMSLLPHLLVENDKVPKSEISGLL